MRRIFQEADDTLQNRLAREAIDQIQRSPNKGEKLYGRITAILETPEHVPTEENPKACI